MPYFKMSKIALKWAFKKPATRNYPFTPRVEMAGSRGQLVFIQEKCTYCTICAKKCPTGALMVNRTTRKWGIDRLLCISCGYCVEFCPKKSLELSTGHGEATVTKNQEIHQGPPVSVPSPPPPTAPEKKAA
jgi:formate hydrogenlyase subunit 6/NADH:ubiquinone oxidoreductase subunit I